VRLSGRIGRWLEARLGLAAAVRESLEHPVPRSSASWAYVLGSGALTIFASGAATAGLQAAAGPAGTGLVILVFVILGNSASGGPFARPLLPGLWRTIGGLLPPGASVDLARSALFFDGARIAGPIVVLVVWAALGTVLALALGGRIMRPTDTEAAAAAGAAV